MNLLASGLQGQDEWFRFLVAMAPPPPGTNPLLAFLPYLLVIAVFYFVLIRPMRSRQQKVQTFLDGLKVNDRVVTSGGIYGTITRVDTDKLQLQIADKVRIDISRNAVVGYQGQPPVNEDAGGGVAAAMTKADQPKS
jgi:preprotein translocase subunit YajC